jgi:large subunit ribosomal protein L27e
MLAILSLPPPTSLVLHAPSFQLSPFINKSTMLIPLFSWSSLTLCRTLCSDTQRPYGHALVAGVERTPLKVTKGMSKKVVAKRSQIKTFVKVVNYNHLMPTRYSVDIPIDKAIVVKSCIKDATTKKEARSEIKKKFEERYSTGQNAWFFSKLRF